jgi:hypothetical protein
MTIAIFESVELERGVLALEAIGATDWTGIIVSSFDTTNTPEVCLEWQPRLTPQRDIDATLRQAVDQYDHLLRRLSD